MAEQSRSAADLQDVSIFASARSVCRLRFAETLMALAATRDDTSPFRLAGVPLGQWWFALRIWIAMVVALALAFWLQLESADTAAITVAILAQPGRGQAYRKGLFFFGGTIVGVVAALAITAAFTQTRDLFLLAFALWLAFTVYVAAFFDGTRSYGAVLSGYTVSIVAVSQIDSPQDVFSAGISRLAAICIGIAAVVLVNDVLASPTVYPTLRDRLAAAHERMRCVVAALVRGDALAPGAEVELLGAITATRLDILAVASEGPSGRERGAAAGWAATAMIEALVGARGFAVMTRDMPDEDAAALRGLVAAGDRAAAEAALDAAAVAPDRTPDLVTRLSVTAALVDRLTEARDGLAAMEAGRAIGRHAALPIHRDREVARLAAVRVFLAVIVAAAVLIASGWSKTSSCLLFVSVLGALSSTMPDARLFARSAMVAIPIAAALAGIDAFVILDGADSFPLLALAMAPGIVVACLLMQRPKVATIGSLMLTFTLVVLSPANPQNYDAQSYVTTAVMVVTAAWLFGALLYGFFPVTAKDRRRWMMRRAWADLQDAMAGRPRHGPADMAYLTADRITVLSRLGVGSEVANRQRLSRMLWLSTLTCVVGRGQRRLDLLPRGTVAPALEAEARAAFAGLDAEMLGRAADGLLATTAEAPADQRRRIAGVAADLGVAARIAALHAAGLRHLRRLAA